MIGTRSADHIRASGHMAAPERFAEMSDDYDRNRAAGGQNALKRWVARSFHEIPMFSESKPTAWGKRCETLQGPQR